jgi:hypothetical protein
MALITCPECKNLISDQASSCPQCGAPVDIQTKNEQNKSKKNGCINAIAIFALISFVLFIIGFVIDSHNKSNENLKRYEENALKVDSIAEAKTRDSINKINEIEEAAFKKTKAYKIQKKHPDWSKEDCKLLAKGKVWIGMHYDMLVYLRGKPNHINTSNYGNGNEYQCCWDNYTPSCFYMKSDDIIYSYN